VKGCLRVLVAFLLVISVRGEVRVFVEDINGVAWIQYECTAGEVVRAFALDVSVDLGQILGISDFFRGESKAGSTGYGIFPAAFRDHIDVSAGTNIDWNVGGYTPLAAVNDAPDDTLPGLNSSGVTLEFGGLWDPTVPAAIPATTGTLCAMHLSEPATVSLAPNFTRGGVVGAFSDSPITPVFLGAVVGPTVTSVTVEQGVLTVLFKDGELQSAPSVGGPWTDTGNTSGQYTESLGTQPTRFFRVRAP